MAVTQGKKHCLNRKIKDRKNKELPFHAVEDALLYAQLSAMVHADCSKLRTTALPSGYKLLRCVRQKKTDTEYMIAVEQNGKYSKVVVAFQGSTSGHDWVLTNFNSGPKAIDNNNPCTVFNKGNRCVHRGFLIALNSVYNEIKCELRHFIKNGDQVYITGFSLGGALATLLTYRIAKDFGKMHQHQINMFAYGTPPVGNKAFNDKFKSFQINSYDITQIGDKISYKRCPIPVILRVSFSRPEARKYYLPRVGGHDLRQYKDQLKSIQTETKYLKAYNLKRPSANIFGYETEPEDNIISNEYVEDGDDYEVEPRDNMMISNEYVEDGNVYEAEYENNEVLIRKYDEQNYE